MYSSSYYITYNISKILFELVPRSEFDLSSLKLRHHICFKNNVSAFVVNLQSTIKYTERKKKVYTKAVIYFGPLYIWYNKRFHILKVEMFVLLMKALNTCYSVQITYCNTRQNSFKSNVQRI